MDDIARVAPRKRRGTPTVSLRPFRRADLPTVIAWRRDPDLRRGTLWSDAVFGPREARRWLRTVSDGDASRVTLAIALRGSGRLVGLTSLTRIDRRAGTAYFGIVVGEKDCWGRGIARETLGRMLRRARALRLRRILLEVAADNARAIELYTRAGFATERVLRRRLARAEGLVDVIAMAFAL
ncbi:MAG TPA: GNAT family N-acetyltransferase [Methylomirabilota bacterium]|nr:GNAT family N-acetyltransferase [Methylomirabilota bacterium]